MQPADVFTCIVTGNDGVVTVNDTASTTLDNRLPSVGAVAITPNPASISDVLTCTASSVVDPDGGSVNLSYEWELGGSVVGTSSHADLCFYKGRCGHMYCDTG